jgi:hypothetical protein
LEKIKKYNKFTQVEQMTIFVKVILRECLEEIKSGQVGIMNIAKLMKISWNVEQSVLKNINEVITHNRLIANGKVSLFKRIEL